MVLFTNYASRELTALARSVGISAVISKDSTDVIIHLIEALRKAKRAGGPVVRIDQLKKSSIELSYSGHPKNIAGVNEATYTAIGRKRP
jgi:hypothetical protein